MAARKKSLVEPRASAGDREFTVVLEDLRSQFKVFGEAMASGFARVDRRLDGMDHRLDGMNHRLDGTDHRLDGMDHRLDGMDPRFDHLDREMGLVKSAVLAHSHELKEIRGAIERIERTKVDRDEVEAIAERVIARSR